MVSIDLSQKREILQLLAIDLPNKCYSSFISDNCEISIIISNDLWVQRAPQLVYKNKFGPIKGITFDIPLDIEVSGFLEPAVLKLAKNNISIVPQCALIYDHIFVQSADLDNSCAVLKQLQGSAKRSLTDT